MKTFNLRTIALILGLVTSQPLPADNRSKLHLPETDTTAAHLHQKELMGAKLRSPSALGYSLTLPRTATQLSKLVFNITHKNLPDAHKKQASRVAKAIIREAARYALDPLFLAAVISHESQFNPDSIGGVGEIGLMQLRPTTAAEINEKFLKLKRFNLKDPVTNIRFGAAYMSYLRGRFDGESQLYISAYNMGAANVRRLLDEDRRPSEYVQKVMKFYVSYVETLNDVLITQKTLKVAKR